LAVRRLLGIDILPHSLAAQLSVHLQAYLNKVARQLNERSRETLQFETLSREI
jgi:hypothetical protein